MSKSPRVRAVRLLGAAALSLSVLLPAALPAMAADPVVLRVGTTQDLDCHEPVQHLPRVGVRGVPAHLQPARRLRQGRAPGPRLRRHLAAQCRQRHVPRPGRDEVVRRGARDLEGRLLQLGPRARGRQGRREHRRRLPGPGRQGRGRHRDLLPRCQHRRRLHDGPVRPHLPDLRPDPAGAHLRQGSTTRRWPTRSSTPPSSAPARTPSSSGRPASSPASCATRTTGAPRASRTRWSSSSSRARTPCSRRSRRARSTTRTT